MAELTGFLRAPLGNLAFSRSQSQVMSETEIVFQTLITVHTEKNQSCGISFPTCSFTYLCLSFCYPLPVLSRTIFFPFVIPLFFFRINLHFPYLPPHDSSQDGWKLTSINKHTQWTQVTILLPLLPVLPAFALQVLCCHACNGIQMQPPSTPGSLL